MVVYTLDCAEGHSFEGWFKSADAYTAEAEAGRLECPVCGSGEIAKGLGTPNVATGKARDAARAEKAARLQAKVMGELKKMRRQVEETCTYVGPRFAEEARRIHYGEVPEKGIYGEATREEVKGLVDEGVPVAPVPDLPKEH